MSKHFFSLPDRAASVLGLPNGYNPVSAVTNIPKSIEFLKSLPRRRIYGTPFGTLDPWGPLSKPEGVNGKPIRRRAMP